MRILAIETSCDETSAAVVAGDGDTVRIVSNIVGSQLKTHIPYGGVVPELAARRHAENIIPIVREALFQANIKEKDISRALDAVAVTYGPGLVIALLVGVETAKSLAFAWGIPLIGVNHLEGHIYSVLGAGPAVYGDNPLSELDAGFFNEPSVALIVSGGHTELVYIEKYGVYQYLGRTRDDAAGEAFDKVARMLGLPYPGGPSLSNSAIKGRRDGYNFPRPMMSDPNCEFSFAGLKTQVLYTVRELEKSGGSQAVGQAAPDIAASFQEAIVDVLIAKTIYAASLRECRSIIITGGVSANSRLREKMSEAAKAYGLSCYFPHPSLTGDNAGMIGIAAYLKVRYTKKYDDVFSLRANPKLSLESAFSNFQ
jgi:N6-L-threonylcarbamoyladenine synthase